VTELMGRG